MIPFFRKIRKQMADDNQFLKYSRYAVGEIVLVVVGILIALQINNWNEDLKIRNKELTYLESIKTDLLLNVEELENFLELRDSCVVSCNRVLDYYEDELEIDLVDFNFHAVNLMIWFPFTQHDNTYRELLNSGNLSLISDKKTKNDLQDMQVGFQKIAFIEGEMQQDYESYLYDVYFTIADVNKNLEQFEAHIESKADATKLSKTEVLDLLKNLKFKNGVRLSKYNSKLLTAEYKQMIETTQNIITRIDDQLNTD